MAPDNHSSCCVELLFKLHILLFYSIAAFPKLPAFLSSNSKKGISQKYFFCVFDLEHFSRKKWLHINVNLTPSLSCRLTSCRDPTKPAAPSDDQSSDAGWSSRSCRLKACGWFLQCSRPNGTNDCNSPAAIIVAVSSYTTSDMSSRYQHYFCQENEQDQSIYESIWRDINTTKKEDLYFSLK